MTDDPPIALMVAEVRKALETGLAPGFAQKVAANALGIVQRELENGLPVSEAEVAWLCGAIRGGQIDDAMVGELIRITVAKLEIDQPSYPPFRQWKDGR